MMGIFKKAILAAAAMVGLSVCAQAQYSVVLTSTTQTIKGAKTFEDFRTSAGFRFRGSCLVYPDATESCTASSGESNTYGQDTSSKTFLQAVVVNSTGGFTSNYHSSAPLMNVSSFNSTGNISIYTNGGSQVMKLTSVGMIGSTDSCFADSTLGTLDLCEATGGDLYLRRYDTSVTAGDTIGSIVFRDRDSSTGGTSDKATYKVTAYGTWGSGNTMEVAHQFQLKRPGASLADYVVISTTGTLITGYPGFTADSTVACDTCTLQVAGHASVTGNLTASSGAFHGSGASSPFVVTASSGIYMTSGKLKLGSGSWVEWPDGTTSTTSARGGSNFTVGFDSATTLGSLSYPGSGATSNNVCLARSTLTVTGHGCPVQVIFNAPASECNSNQQVGTSFLLNGAFVSGMSAGVWPGLGPCSGTGVTGNFGFNVKIPAPSAGTLNFCAIAYSSVGNFESTLAVPQFRVVENCNISN